MKNVRKAFNKLHLIGSQHHDHQIIASSKHHARKTINANILVIGDSESHAKGLTNCLQSHYTSVNYKDDHFALSFEFVNTHDLSLFNFEHVPQLLERSGAVLYVVNLNSKAHWLETSQFIEECMELDECDLPVIFVGTRTPITSPISATPSDTQFVENEMNISVFDVENFIEQSGRFDCFVFSDFGMQDTEDNKEAVVVLKPLLESLMETDGRTD